MSSNTTPILPNSDSSVSKTRAAISLLQSSQEALDRTRLRISWFTLLNLGSMCCLLAVGVILQLAYLKPSPKEAIALRAIIIPEASSEAISDGFRYRHFISQIVQRNRQHNFFEGRDLSDMIIRISMQENIDPLFVASIIKAESTFFSGAISNQGARGLMQIQAGTAAYISNLIDEPWQGERFLHDPEYNLRLGISYLKYLSRKFNGNIERTLAAYNWGPGNVKKSGGAFAALPAETKKYISVVLGNHRRWKAELKQQTAASEQLKKLDLA